jgi:hypothetical protein
MSRPVNLSVVSSVAAMLLASSGLFAQCSFNSSSIGFKDETPCTDAPQAYGEILVMPATAQASNSPTTTGKTGLPHGSHCPPARSPADEETAQPR